MTGTIVPRKEETIKYSTSPKGSPQANFTLQTFNGNKVGVTIYNSQVEILKPFLKENAIVKLEANLRQRKANDASGKTVVYNNVTIDDNNHSTIEVYLDAVSIAQLIDNKLAQLTLDNINADVSNEEKEEQINENVSENVF